MDSGWKRILAGLETFATFFFVFGPTVDIPMDENRLLHNAMTRRIDPHYQEGPWIFSEVEVDLGILNFPDLGLLGPRAQGPYGTRGTPTILEILPPPIPARLQGPLEN